MEKVIERGCEKNSKCDDTLYIIIPAYNEMDNIYKVVEEWYPIVEAHGSNGTSRLVIIDDGSKDDTLLILRSLAKDRPLLKVVEKLNEGHGATVLYGYRMALNEGADYVFQTDSDGQTRPAEFEQFWKLRSENDMVIGWRKGREDGWSRVIVTKVLKLVIRLCFGVSLADANTPFRLIKVPTLREYIGLIPENYHLSNVLLAVIFSKKNCAVTYLPITFRPRQGGINSINIRRIIGIGWRAIKEFSQIAKAISSV